MATTQHREVPPYARWAYGEIGRRAGFRFQWITHGGSSPLARTICAPGPRRLPGARRGRGPLWSGRPFFDVGVHLAHNVPP